MLHTRCCRFESYQLYFRTIGLDCDKIYMRRFFTSDTHFFHKNIIRLCNRPFADVKEMHDTIVNNWNRVVLPEDEVYHIGDFSFGSRKQTHEILDRLMGKVHLIYGNHDQVVRKNKELQDRFVWCKELHELKIPDENAHRGEQKIVLCHYAMRVWNKSHHGAWHLYGHSHGSLPEDPNSLSFDIGVDPNGFKLLDLEDVEARMKHKKFVPVDHHE